MTNRVNNPSTAKLVAAFAAIYLIWGSTFLAIRYAIETMPPFLMAGARFLISGLLLYALARLRGEAAADRGSWLKASVIGALLFLCGNGSVVWSQQRVSSGMAALIVAIIPIWMVLIDWLQRGRKGLDKKVVIGLILGFSGLALLISPSKLIGGGQADALGAGVLVTGAFCWAYGSLYARTAKITAAPMMSTAITMLSGGALLLLAGLATGESSRFDINAFSLRSVLSLAYLIVFGAIIAFSAYNWLLKVTTPARVATYAYVNPGVAVLLGWLLGGEPLTVRMICAVVVIVTAVVIINTARQQESQTTETQSSAESEDNTAFAQIRPLLAGAAKGEQVD